MAKEKVEDEFTQYAKEVAAKEAEEQAARASRGAGGGGFQGFEKIKWTGLEKGKQKILRPLGGVPNSGKSPFTARTVRIANIVADDGKVIKVRYPIDGLEAESWILTRIVDRVTEATWIKVGEKNQKVFVQEKKNPDIFEMVTHNGLDASNPKRKFGPEGKGWNGRAMFLMNVLSRDPTEYAWSQENKHSMLLSKNVTVVAAKDGSGNIEFAEDGVPEYGFTNLLSQNLFRSYGSWENYDISIERTGQTNPPMNVINACKHIEEIAEELQDFIVEGPLTEEEKSWTQYDLDKLYGTTSYSKIYDKLKLSIAKIDAALGTHYLTELESLKKKEQAERDAANAAKAAEVTGEEAPAVQGSSEAKVAPASVRPEVKDDELPAFGKLTETEKKLIKSFTKTGEKSYRVEYATDTKQYACPHCGTNAPADFELCPGCGLSF